MELSTQASEQKITLGSAERLIRAVRRKIRRRFSAEDKIRIVLEGFRKEITVMDLCRREGISTALYYPWLKDFMEAGQGPPQGRYPSERHCL